MSDETDTTSDVARVLRDHTRIDGIHGDCLCKHVVPLGHSFAVHQAEALAEAGLLRDQATIDALNERCRILVDEGDAFRNDLTNLRDGLMERVGRYTPSDADLLAYVDGLRAQIATQEPAGGAQGGSAGRGASGGLGERLRALVAGPHPDVLLVLTAQAEYLGIVEQVERLEATSNGARIKVQLDRVVALAEKWDKAADRRSDLDDDLFDSTAADAYRSRAADLRDVLAQEVP